MGLKFDVGIVKRHPYIAAAVAVLCLFIFWKLSGWGQSSGQSSMVVAQNTGPSEAQLAAQIQMQAIQANNATALEAKRIETAAALDAVEIGAELSKYQLDTQSQVAMRSLASNDFLTATQLEALRVSSAASLEGMNIEAELQKMNMRQQYGLEEIRLRTEYDQAAWNYYNTQTAIRLADDTANRALIANTQTTNTLLDIIKAA